MAWKRSNLAWTNIGRDDLSNQSQEAWDMFLVAKAELEQRLGQAAINEGMAKEGDTFKFAYGSIGQGSIGMAIAEPEKPQRGAGFAGLKRPIAKPNLEEYLNGQDNAGYRR